jgi:hypothetical protein
VGEIHPHTFQHRTYSRVRDTSGCCWGSPPPLPSAPLAVHALHSACHGYSRVLYWVMHGGDPPHRHTGTCETARAVLPPPPHSAPHPIPVMLCAVTCPTPLVASPLNAASGAADTAILHAICLQCYLQQAPLLHRRHTLQLTLHGLCCPPPFLRCAPPPSTLCCVQ